MFLPIVALFAMSFAFILFFIFLQKKLEKIETQTLESFKSLSYEIMERSQRSFLDLAKTSFSPIQETMKQIGEIQKDLEKKREGAYASLSKQVDGMAEAERALRRETTQLIQSLRSPQVSGSWGQVHLKRVVELAGLVNHCDFVEQKAFVTEGKLWRPDLIVQLPGDRCIAIDAKTPLTAYLDAGVEENEEMKKKKMLEHAGLLRRHIKELSSKEYWKQFAPSLEYVILFLPAEAFFSAALQADPSLIEAGADQNVVLATPTTLIAILRAVAFSWKQEALTKSTREIARLGQELYERIGTLGEHWNKVGKSLGSAVDAYNQSLSSFESRVSVTARKLKEAGSLSQPLSEVEAVAKIVKNMPSLDAVREEI